MPLALKRPLTASGAIVTADDAKVRQRLSLGWQERAWEYYDALGEIKYASQYYSRTLAKIELRVEERIGTDEWAPSNNPDAIAALDRVSLTSKQRATYGRLFFLVGECYLACFFGEAGEGSPVTEEWCVCSCDELTYRDGVYKRKVTGGAEAKDYPEVPEGEDPSPGQCFAVRFWREHPRFSGEPDSSVRGVLDDCEELMSLKQAIRAQSRSRASNSGILLISDAISRKPVDPRAADDDPREDQFIADLGRHLMTPIADEGSAAALVPFTVRVPEMVGLDKAMLHIQLATAELYKETGLREECLGRIAIGLDMPREILEGLTDSNHWSAWQVDADSFKDHLEPFCDAFVADLTEAYYVPTLRKQGVTDPTNYRIGYDAASVITHPNRGQDAKDDHDRMVLSDKALRTATGFDEKDAPSAQELAERTARIRPGIAGGVGRPQPAGTEPVVPPVAEAPAQAPVQASYLQERLMDWAELCVERAREVAGSRLRTKTKEPALQAKIRSVPNRLVAATLGPENVNGSDPDNLVAGAGDVFQTHLQNRGIEPSVARHLVRVCEEHAATTLYDTDPGLNDEILGLCGLAGLAMT